MQCQKCKQQSATIHLTEIHNGKRQETHLCPVCAEEEGLAVKNQVPLNELLSTLLAAQSQSQDPQSADPKVTTDLLCESCGTTFDQFKKEASLGCPDDYEAFEKPLKLILENAHNGNTEHVGKAPSSLPGDQQAQYQLAQLRKQLDEAVRMENYELAANLKSKIEHMQ
jgi:protein arginine kinase activator